jgi:hypothetical protein
VFSFVVLRCGCRTRYGSVRPRLVLENEIVHLLETFHQLVSIRATFSVELFVEQLHRSMKQSDVVLRQLHLKVLG